MLIKYLNNLLVGLVSAEENIKKEIKDYSGNSDSKFIFYKIVMFYAD